MKKSTKYQFSTYIVSSLVFFSCINLNAALFEEQNAFYEHTSILNNSHYSTQDDQFKRKQFDKLISSKLLDIFNETNKSYMSGYCNDNIYLFLRNIAEANIDLTEAKVLFVYTHALDEKFDSEFDTLTASSSRSNRPELWRYHVVLLFNNYVYDFDFTSNPKPTELNLWLKQMWQMTKLTKEPTFQNDLNKTTFLFYKEYSSNFYLQNYLNRNGFVSTPEGKYPSLYFIWQDLENNVIEKRLSDLINQ